MGKGSSGTSTVERAAPTPEETEIMRVQGLILGQMYEGFVRENAALASAYPWMAAVTRATSQAATQQAQLTSARTQAAIRGAPLEEQAFYDAAAMMGLGTNMRTPYTGGGRFGALYEPIPTVPGPAAPTTPPPGGGTGTPGPPAPPDLGGGGGGSGGSATAGPGGTTGEGNAGAPGEGSTAGASGTGGGQAGVGGGASGAGNPGEGGASSSTGGGEGGAGDAAGTGGSGGNLKMGAPLQAQSDQASVDVANAVQSVLGTTGSNGTTGEQNLIRAVQSGQTTVQGIAAGLTSQGYDPRVAQGVAAAISQRLPGQATPANVDVANAANAVLNTRGASGVTGAQNLMNAVRQGVTTPDGIRTFLIQQGYDPQVAAEVSRQIGQNLGLPTIGATSPAAPTGAVSGLPATGPSTLPTTRPLTTSPTGPAVAEAIVQDVITRSGLLPTQEGYVQMLRQVDRMTGQGATPAQISDYLISVAPASGNLIAGPAPAPGGTGLSAYERTFPAMSQQFATDTLTGTTIDQLSLADQGRIGTVYDTASRRADEELTKFANDLAAARGLRATDTPIGAEALRQRGITAEQIAAARANTELTMGASQRQFRESTRQFQEGLQQQAYLNRMQLAGRAGGGATASPTVGAPAYTPGSGSSAINSATGMLNQAAGNRGTTTTTSGQTDQTGSYLQAGATVLAAALPLMLSTARVKKDITPFDRDEYDRALRKMRETPVTRWRYLWELDDKRPHTGPILELSPDEIKADEYHLDLLSYSGMTHAALKGLDRKVDRLAEAFLQTVKA